MIFHVAVSAIAIEFSLNSLANSSYYAGNVGEGDEP